MSIPDTVFSAVPRNEEAERCLLGALLRSNDLYEILTEEDLLTPEHFYDPDHAEVFRLIVEALENRRTASPITLGRHIEKGLLNALCSASISTTKREFRDWALEISEKAARRRICSAAKELAEDAVSSPWGTTASSMVASAEAKLMTLTPEAAGGGLVAFNVALDEAMEEIRQAQSPQNVDLLITTGLTELDQKLGCLVGGQLVVVAGRPAMGKTAFAKRIGDHNAAQGKNVAFFSMEMQRAELAKRRIAEETGISLLRQREPLTDAEHHKIAMAAARLRADNLPLYVDHESNLTLAQVRARARRMHRKIGLRLIIIDYLELMGDEPHMLNVNKNYQLGYITRGLKGLAKELNVPVVLLVQVNRKVEDREDKRPHMSDLKDSGNIEQDADIVLFVFREEVYLRKETPTKGPHETDSAFADRKNQHYDDLARSEGKAEILIEKNRSGPWPEKAIVGFDGVRTLFTNLEESF